MKHFGTPWKLSSETLFKLKCCGSSRRRFYPTDLTRVRVGYNKRGRPKGWIHSPVNNRSTVFFCVSISHSFSFLCPNGISSDRIVTLGFNLVLIDPYRRRLPHEAGRAAVLGTNF